MSNTNIINHIYKVVDFECTISSYSINNYDNCLWFRNGLKYKYYNNNYTNLTAYFFVNGSIIYDKILLNKVLIKNIYVLKWTMNSMRNTNHIGYKNFINESIILCGLLNYTLLEDILNNDNSFKYIFSTFYNLGYVDLLQYYLLLNNNILFGKIFKSNNRAFEYPSS